MQVAETIFRTYDIRGVYPDELSDEVVLHLGRAIGTNFIRKSGKKEFTIVVGRDNRESSPSVLKAFVEGAVSTGCNVTYVGITHFPALHYLSFKTEFDGAVFITASHNPGKFNGLKIEFSDANTVWGDEIHGLYELIIEEDYECGRGTYVEEEMKHLYSDYVSRQFAFKEEIKVVLGCGGGTASIDAPEILRKAGAVVIPLGCELDSNYPMGVPNPEDRIFMERISVEVVKNKADIGIGYDTDVDRIGVVDEKGKLYGTDELLLLFSKYLLEEKPGSRILYDVKSSSRVEELIKDWGGDPVLLRTGRSYFLEEIMSGKAELGAELSGHVYFGDKYFGYDDAIYASCRLLGILDKKKKPLSELMSILPKRAGVSEIKVTCPDNIKFEIIKTVQENIAAQKDRYRNVIYIDGVRVYVSDTGWFLIRASNTSPYLSVRAEGLNETELSSLLSEVIYLLSAYENLDLSEIQRLIEQ